MKPDRPIEHEFVDFTPKNCEDGKLYVSIKYATAVHSCFCGCRTEVVTPLNPTGWQLPYDGDTVSLHPSVGNWGFPCRSHYWIKRDRVVWAGDMSDEDIESGRARDRANRDSYFAASQAASNVTPVPKVEPPSTKEVGRKKSRLWRWLTGR